MANQSFTGVGAGSLNSAAGIQAAQAGVTQSTLGLNSSNVGSYRNSNGSIDTQAIIDAIIGRLNLSDPSNYLQSAIDLANLNTASSEAMAREQMAYQTKANALAMDFSASEAQKTRDWQTMMSNTAHQREVTDLIAAGLNPILSANQGAAVGSAANAAGVTSSGAKGTVDTSAVQALTQAYVQAKQIEMQGASLAMEQKKIDAQLAMNVLSNETQRYSADTAAKASMYGSQLSSSAHRYAAELDYSTWASGLHNQYAQLGEWIYKAISGLDFSNMFNISNSLGDAINNLLKPDKGDGTGYRTHSKNEQPLTPSTEFQDLHGRTWMHLNQVQ